MGDLEALETITALCLLADDIEDGIDELGTFGVMSLGPVVTRTGLAEYEVVWTEELSEWSGTDRIHRAWLQIHEDGAWHVSAAGSLIEVDVDALELEVGISVI